MIAADKQKILRRYESLFKQYGYDQKSLGWNDARAALRYKVLFEHWNLKKTHILDFGCGFGDAYELIQKMKLGTCYHGVDINPSLIEQGKKIYPKADLQVRDIFSDGLKQKYDYIFSSGAHNFKLKDNAGYIRESFRLFDRFSKKGFALNFLSDQVDYRLPHAHHANPAQILELAYRYSRRVFFRNDYMPFEFTVFVDKNTHFDKKLPVFDEYRSFCLGKKS